MSSLINILFIIIISLMFYYTYQCLKQNEKYIIPELSVWLARKKAKKDDEDEEEEWRKKRFYRRYRKYLK